MTVFRNQVLALASPADVQIGLVPQGVCIGDELVCDFDCHKVEFIATQKLTAQQLNAIQALDSFLLELSGPHNEVFWCDPEPLTDDPRWEQIRELARTVLQSMNWDYAPPEKDGATYVFEDRVEVNLDEGEDSPARGTGSGRDVGDTGAT